MTNLTRSPAVAGRFYPGDAESLRSAIQEMSRDVPSEKKEVLAAVSPHAGYVYSGAVAAKTLGCIKVPETVILLGPNHTGQGAPVGRAACRLGQSGRPRKRRGVSANIAGGSAAKRSK